MSLKPGPHQASCLFIFCFISILSFSQDWGTDSLKNISARLPDSREKVEVLLKISQAYLNTSFEKAVSYAGHARDIAIKINYEDGLADSYRMLGMVYKRQGQYPEALDAYSASLEIYKNIKDLAGQSRILNNLGSLYADEAGDGEDKATKLGNIAIGQQTKAIEYYSEALKLAELAKDNRRIVTTLSNIGNVYLNNSKTYDKALEYWLRAVPIANELRDRIITGTVTVNIGEVYTSKRKYDSAMLYFRQSLTAFEPTGDVCYTLNDIAKLYEAQQNYDSALIYHNRALTIATNAGAKEDMVGSLLGIGQVYHRQGKIKPAVSAYQKAEDIGKSLDSKFQLKECYKGLAASYAAMNNYGLAFKYQTLLGDIKDSIYKLETAQKLARLDFTFQIEKRQDKLLKEADLRRQKIARNAVAGGFLLVFIMAFILYRGYRNKVKTNKVLDQQLADLRSAQAQLIQSEKMASLGQLTAGIAHEIQNPLNFVNNFSELNKELIEELKGEKLKAKDKRDEDLETELLNDIIQNLEKISHHGQRADAIVRGMLQHSQGSSGQRELTDVNALADEYLRLAYHGLRAKNKSFDVRLVTHFDSRIVKLNIAPQEIGRVILNLINNAFYAVTEKQRQNIPGYEPIVTVTTQRNDGHVLLSVADNGNGIPQKIFDKIFQPFFTTKPTGQGTGLGLSLAYDIVTAHSGKIKVHTKEGTGSDFIVEIPTK